MLSKVESPYLIAIRCVVHSEWTDGLGNRLNLVLKLRRHEEKCVIDSALVAHAFDTILASVNLFS